MYMARTSGGANTRLCHDFFATPADYGGSVWREARRDAIYSVNSTPPFTPCRITPVISLSGVSHIISLCDAIPSERHDLQCTFTPYMAGRTICETETGRAGALAPPPLYATLSVFYVSNPVIQALNERRDFPKISYLFAYAVYKVRSPVMR